MTLQTANEEQLNFWDGPGGDHWAEHEEVYNNSVANYMPAFMAAANVGASDTVLDIGCGNGETTRLAARLAPDGRVLGVDISAAMVQVARKHAEDESITNVEFIQADAQIYDLGREQFSVCISRTGAMFFADPIAGFTNIARSLKSGGRLVLLAWQPYDRNEWQSALSDALALGRSFPKPEVSKPGPMGLADPDFTRTVLGAAGFSQITVESVEREFSFGVDAKAAYDFIVSLGFTKGALEPLNSDDRKKALNQLRETIEEHARDDGVWFGSATWLVTAIRQP